MKKKIIICVVFFISALICFSQEKEKKSSRILDKNGIIQSITFPDGLRSDEIPSSSDVFFKTFLKPSINDEFKKAQERSKSKEFKHEHFDQYYNGVKVEGAGYNFHYKNGIIYFAHGHYVKIGDFNVMPAITPENAKQSFAKYKKIPESSIKDFISELIIKEITSEGIGDTHLPKLVYKIYLYADHENNKEVGFIDAYTGNVIMTELNLIDVAATGTFATRYSGSRQAITEDISGTFHLEDLTRGATIHTWNLNGSTSTANRVDLTDNDNNWTSGEHSASENDMGLDVHWALQQIYDRLNNQYGINSFDDNGFAINAHIHYGTSTPDRDNAFWDLTNNVLLFGDGAVEFRPVASLDAVAHEFGHGITDFQIGWPYSGDGAAFHEGMSDIWGVIMESRILPSTIWNIGEQLTLNFSTLRNLQNTNDPNALAPISDTFLSTQYNSGSNYVRSGVFSHWFYILVEGESGTNDIGNNYNVAGIGMDLAEPIIREAVFNNYLDNTTSYPEVRAAMISVATALYGANTCEVRSVTNAWYAVGVGDPASTPNTYVSGPALVCTDGTFSLNNPLTLNGSFNHITWSVNPSNLVTPSSGTGITANVTKIGNGNPVMSFNPGCGINNASLQFHTGPYSSSDYPISGPSSAPCNAYVYYSIPTLSGVTSINWTWPPGWTYVSGQGTANLALRIKSSGVVAVGVNNTCGQSGSYATKYTSMSGSCGFGSFSVHPNPASNELNLSFVDIDSKATNNPEELESFYDIKIYNNYQELIYSTTSNRIQLKIDTDNFPPGAYILNVINKEGIIQRKIFITR